MTSSSTRTESRHVCTLLQTFCFGVDCIRKVQLQRERWPMVRMLRLRSPVFHALAMAIMACFLMAMMNIGPKGDSLRAVFGVVFFLTPMFYGVICLFAFVVRRLMALFTKQ